MPKRLIWFPLSGSYLSVSSHINLPMLYEAHDLILESLRIDAPLLAYIGPGAGFTFLSSFLVLFAAIGLLMLSVATWPIRFVMQWIRRLRSGVRGSAKRVVVVGLDGLDPQRVRRLMDADRLPNFRKLRDSGTFTDLATTLPPISPVAWSSFMTGVNPGKHNIFDFLNRDLRSYLPELSSAKAEDAGGRSFWSRFGLGGSGVRMLRKSQPFWRVLGEHGIFSTILRVPITFPPERFFGLSLSAMCTPDLRGTQGTFTMYSSNQQECDESSGGLWVHVTPVENRIETTLTGPPNQPGRRPSELEVPLVLKLDPQKQSASLSVSGQTISLAPGVYSDWVRITFRCGPLRKVHGICRFRLESIGPEFRMYVTPINIDPERPAMSISVPLYYSLYLSKLHSSFATLGLAEDMWALNSGAIDEAAFLEQAWAIHAEREAMFFDALARTRRGLCVCVFDGSDRIQHMFYRHDRADHPTNKNRDTQRHAHVIDEMYERMDALVGRVQEAVDDDTVLLVLSDHGFCEFSRGMNVNVWLQDQGYLVLKDGAETGEYFHGVDWSRTKAYAFGLNGIYINQTGREAQGIVSPTEAADLRTEIVAKLRAVTDEDRHARPIHEAYDSRQAYHGPYVENGPDVILGFAKGYRVSWETAVGRTDGELFADNIRYWSGDHCVDPPLVPGLLASNHVLSRSDPAIIDLAPTILNLFGIPVPKYMDGVAMTVSQNASETMHRTTEPHAEPVEATV